MTADADNANAGQPGNAQVLIVGAGPTGLAAAAELGRLGVSAEILERGDTIGAAWRSRYDRLRLNTHRRVSGLPGSKFPRGTPDYASRDQFVRYLDSYAERHHLRVRFGVRVDRVDPCADGWTLTTSAGPRTARQVIFTIGSLHTPVLPDWPQADKYPGIIVHTAAYRNASEFKDHDVLVVGAGCSATDIACDLIEGGARRVRLAIRTQPNLMLRKIAGVIPGDLLMTVLFKVRPRIADTVASLVRRTTIGNLAPWGLTPPAEGPFAAFARTGKAPTFVDSQLLRAVRADRVEVVDGVAKVDGDAVELLNGITLKPDSIIVATGFCSGLEPIVGHLGVLDGDGMPKVHDGPAAAPGLRFFGYVLGLSTMGRRARDTMSQVSRELALGIPGPSPHRFPTQCGASAGDGS